MADVERRRNSAVERHPSTICQRSTSLTYRRKLVPWIDILIFPEFERPGNFSDLCPTRPYEEGDIYRITFWESSDRENRSVNRILGKYLRDTVTRNVT